MTSVVTSQTSKPTTLPPPSTFDILPPLHALLSRLLLPASQPSTQTPFSPPITSSPALTNPTNTTPLAPKDLATASSIVKIKIQKARVAIRGLPDMERTIEEQELEIWELEKEVERVNGILVGIREAARRALTEEST
jgi:hypothetical protein